MAIDTKPIIALISQSKMDEIIETYDDMDYEDFDTFCDYFLIILIKTNRIIFIQQFLMILLHFIHIKLLLIVALLLQ